MSRARRAVVLVEGDSDRCALLALAALRGRDLAAEGVLITPMGGATNLRRFLTAYLPDGDPGSPQGAITLAGLCDRAEEGFFRRALTAAGLLPDDAPPGREPLEALGFFVCEPDLEGELIRALGAPQVEQVIAAQGELASLHRLQRQRAQQGRPLEQQLHRFLGTRSGRKSQYARLLTQAVAPERVPRPLAAVLAAVPPC